MKHACCFILLLIICGCGDISKQIREIKADKLSIPKHELVTWSQNGRSDPRADSTLLSLLFYVSEEQCQSCFFSQLVKYERENYESLACQGVGLVYIFSGMNIDKDILESELQTARIRGDAYIDTCGAFLHTNQHIPDNPLYHTFVVDNNGNVLMVGNPFQNSKMKSLFHKVIANARKQNNKEKIP